MLLNLKYEFLPAAYDLINILDWPFESYCAISDSVPLEILGQSLPGHDDVVWRIAELRRPLFHGQMGPFTELLLG